MDRIHHQQYLYEGCLYLSPATWMKPGKKKCAGSLARMRVFMLGRSSSIPGHPVNNLTAEGHSSGGHESESVSAPRPPGRKDQTV